MIRRLQRQAQELENAIADEREDIDTARTANAAVRLRVNVAGSQDLGSKQSRVMQNATDEAQSLELKRRIDRAQLRASAVAKALGRASSSSLSSSPSSTTITATSDAKKKFGAVIGDLEAVARRVMSKMGRHTTKDTGDDSEQEDNRGAQNRSIVPSNRSGDAFISSREMALQRAIARIHLQVTHAEVAVEAEAPFEIVGAILDRESIPAQQSNGSAVKNWLAMNEYEEEEGMKRRSNTPLIPIVTGLG